MTPASGSGYVNFGQYIEANKDNSNRVAGEVAGGIGKAAGQAQAGLQKAQRGFGMGLATGNPFGGQSMAAAPSGRHEVGAPVAPPVAGITPVATPAQSMQGAPGTTKQGMTSAPTQGPGSGAPAGAPTISIEEARARAGQGYTGPKGLDISADLRKQTGAAQSQLGLTKDEGGLEALLRQKYGGAGYGKAQSRFDAALTGQAGGSRFRELRSKYGNLTGTLSAAEAAAAGRAKAAEAEVAATAGKYGSQVTAYDQEQAEREKNIKETAEKAKAKAAADAERLAGAPSWEKMSGTPFDDRTSPYGLNKSQYDALPPDLKYEMNDIESMPGKGVVIPFTAQQQQQQNEYKQRRDAFLARLKASKGGM
jgi:hypothetical protein